MTKKHNPLPRKTVKNVTDRRTIEYHPKQICTRNTKKKQERSSLVRNHRRRRKKKNVSPDISAWHTREVHAFLHVPVPRLYRYFACHGLAHGHKGSHNINSALTHFFSSFSRRSIDKDLITFFGYYSVFLVFLFSTFIVVRMCAVCVNVCCPSE